MRYLASVRKLRLACEGCRSRGRVCAFTQALPCPQKKDAHAISDAQLEKEREQLAKALERLADVQHELADGQRNLMNGELLPAACAWWEA